MIKFFGDLARFLKHLCLRGLFFKIFALGAMTLKTLKICLEPWKILNKYVLTYVANWLIGVGKHNASFTSDGTISGECVPRVTSYWQYSTVVDWERLRCFQVVNTWQRCACVWNKKSNNFKSNFTFVGEGQGVPSPKNCF